MKFKQKFLPACALVFALGSAFTLSGCAAVGITEYEPRFDSNLVEPQIDLELDEARGVHGQLKTEFQHGRALVKNSENRWGIINEDGHYLLACIAYEVLFFDGRTALIDLRLSSGYIRSLHFMDLDQIEMTRRLYEDYFGQELEPSRSLAP